MKQEGLQNIVDCETIADQISLLDISKKQNKLTFDPHFDKELKSIETTITPLNSQKKSEESLKSESHHNLTEE